MSVFASCTDNTVEDNQAKPTEGLHVVTLSAGFVKESTRSAVSEYGYFSWLPGDKIKVLSTDENFYDFAYDGEVQASRGNFTGEIEGIQTSFAVSPSTIAPASMGTKFMVTLPGAYTSIDKQANAPMIARLEEGATTGLQFRNLAGMMMINVKNIPAGTSHLIVTTDNQQLSGQFEVVEEEGFSVIKPAASSELNKIDITYTSTEVDRRLFFIPMPIGEYSNVHVEMVNEAGTWFSKTAQTMTIGRNQIIVMPTITCGATPSTAQQVITDTENTAETINQMLEEAATKQENEGALTDLSITIANTASEDGAPEEELVSTVEVKEELVIPATITKAEPVGEVVPSVSLTFDAVPTSTNTKELDGEVVSNLISVTDKTETTETVSSSKSEIMISIPSVEVEIEGETFVEAEAPSFEINLPTSTVTLSAKGESARYDVVYATTAENTLRIDRGVTVNKIIVGSGNVVAKGTIGDIVNNTDRVIIVTLEENAKITGTVGNNIIIVDNTVPGAPAEIADAFDNESTADGVKVTYEISTIGQLRRMAMLVNSGQENANMRPYSSCNFKLVADIDAGLVNDWIPIGFGRLFEGAFDGGNHTIKGNFVVKETQNAALFYLVLNATIKNLIVEGSIINDSEYSYKNASAIAFDVQRSTIENCVNRANVICKQPNIPSEEYYIINLGGIACQIYESSIIACGNEGLLSGGSLDHIVKAGLVCSSSNSTIAASYDISDEQGLCNNMNDTRVYGSWSKKLVRNPYNSGFYSSALNSCFFGYISNDMPAEVLNCGRFEGDQPSAAQIAAMNSVTEAYGWIFDSNARPIKSDKTGIPDNPVNPWLN